MDKRCLSVWCAAPASLVCSLGRAHCAGETLLPGGRRRGHAHSMARRAAEPRAASPDRCWVEGWSCVLSSCV